MNARDIRFKLIIIIAALFFFSAESLSAFVTSRYLGGWPGICEDGQCYDDGVPLSDGPADVKRHILQHQLTSPTCPTDLIYISIEYPSNTGSEALDQRLLKAAEKNFNQAKKRALQLTCNDFYGCLGVCLPIGIEHKYYFQTPSAGYLSLFEVERFIGNFRQNSHLRGTVDYSFTNYNLTTGAPLTLKDIFKSPNKSVPAFWKKIEQVLSENNNCRLDKLYVGGRRISSVSLNPKDLILTRGGATIAVWSPKSGTCRSEAIDLTIQEMIEIGANPAVWGAGPQ
ncbi:MAG: hypothetical protein LBT62_08045 [Deltaproteobacteria bacterium]|jgi:hypothetical protein|nr:hypothetical protein [Deltaproteobacteria bacterium]